MDTNYRRSNITIIDTYYPKPLEFSHAMFRTRLLEDITLKKLAQETGIRMSKLSDFERGHYMPSDVERRKIRTILYAEDSTHGDA